MFHGFKRDDSEFLMIYLLKNFEEIPAIVKWGFTRRHILHLHTIRLYILFSKILDIG